MCFKGYLLVWVSFSLLCYQDTSNDDEETEADDQESFAGAIDDTGSSDQELSAGEADDTGASDEESSDGEEEEEEIERELLKELLARRLFKMQNPHS